MIAGDVTFEFRLPEFGILLLALFLIYGITWAKDAIEDWLRTRTPAVAAAGAGEPPISTMTDAPAAAEPDPDESSPDDPSDDP